MSAINNKPGILTFHHLNNSQSQRVFWFLEELGIEYNLVLHTRVADRAPPELKNVHFMGKAPIIVTPENQAIAETSAILNYLLQTYDKDGKFKPKDAIREEVLTSFAGTTVGPIGTVEMIFDIVASKSPWPMSTVLRAVKGQVHKNFTGPEYALQFEYLEKELGDQAWFNGDDLGKADVMLSWPCDVLAARKYVDFQKYPKIAQWRNRIQERDAWKSAMKKGNGYSLGDF